MPQLGAPQSPSPSSSSAAASSPSTPTTLPPPPTPPTPPSLPRPSPLPHHQHYHHQHHHHHYHQHHHHNHHHHHQRNHHHHHHHHYHTTNKTTTNTIIIITTSTTIATTINNITTSPRRLLLSARVSYADLYKKRTNGNRLTARVPAQYPRARGPARLKNLNYGNKNSQQILVKKQTKTWFLISLLRPLSNFFLINLIFYTKEFQGLIHNSSIIQIELDDTCTT